MCFWLALSSVCLADDTGAAQESDKLKQPTSSATGELSAAEMAKESHNPLGHLREIILQLDILPDVGPEKKTEWVETIGFGVGPRQVQLPQ